MKLCIILRKVAYVEQCKVLERRRQGMREEKINEVKEKGRGMKETEVGKETTLECFERSEIRRKQGRSRLRLKQMKQRGKERRK